MRLFTTITLCMLAFASAGCTTGNGDGESINVEVDDDYFEVQGQPQTKNSTATASVGDTYRFEHEGKRGHTVTIHRPPAPATEYLMDEVIASGDEVEFQFDEPGTYHIWCRFHGEMTSGMHLTVTVG